MKNSLTLRVSAVWSVGLAALILLLLLTGTVLAEPDGGPSSDGPWWSKQKIRYFWGQWNRYRSELRDDPAKYLAHNEALIKNLGQIGATIFVRYRPGFQSIYEENQARLARKYGLRYFGIMYLHTLASHGKGLSPDRRISVNRDGKPYGGEKFGLLPCPLYRPVYEKWFLKPILDAARTGLVDGIQMDWEPYGERSEARFCYCDDCFNKLLADQGATVDQSIPKEQRHAWLERQGFLDAFKSQFRKRRIEMFRGFAQEVHKINPQFIFAGYDMIQWAPEIAEGLHDPQTPFFNVDNRHMYESHDRPWWQSLHAESKEAGYIRIAGTYGHTLFGSHPQNDVSAAQMLYDLALNSDGYWVWLEQEITPDSWRTFWIANRMLYATESKVGDYLRRGTIDTRFVTLVEWTGDPSLDEKLRHHTFHLNDRHLVQINNVHTDWPVRIRLRFPHLPAGSRWRLTDAISDLSVVFEDRQAVWTEKQLNKGVVVSLAKRSDLFLELTPTLQDTEIVTAPVLVSDEGEMMPPHPPGEPFSLSVGLGGNENSLAVTVTERMGFDGTHAWTVGNAIHTVNLPDKTTKRLRQIKGYLWSPTWSPDGRQIAFVHYTNGRGQIYSINPEREGSKWVYKDGVPKPPKLPDGSKWVNLSRNDFCDRHPAWSPNGGQIAFLSDRDGVWNIYAMDADGGNQRQITKYDGRDSQISWSPDGGRIAFCRDAGGQVDVYVVNADGSDPRRIIERPGDQWSPAWSPDGRRIACVGVHANSLNELLIADFESGEINKIMRMNRIGEPKWSPDGKRVAGVFTGYDKPDTAGIFLIDVDSYASGFNPFWGLSPGLKDEFRLAEAPGIRPHTADTKGGRPQPSWYSKGGGSPRWVVKTFSGVTWSPDGKRLAFSSDMSDDGDFYVYVVPTEGGNPVKLETTRSAWPQQISWTSR
jgi:hypothetical protein